jgi:hypothetical protein
MDRSNFDLGDDTPIAKSLYRFREKVYKHKIGPGAVHELARELDITESTLRKLVMPKAIETVAEVERHIESSK